MLSRGWEFFILNPFDENMYKANKNLYNKNYNDSYYKFINELCIPNPDELFFEDNLFTFYISCVGEMDKIILDEKFDITFLKSLFIKTKYKHIKLEIEKYYYKFDILVRNFYKSGDYIFLIIEKK
jgi:hypothetical protein